MGVIRWLLRWLILTWDRLTHPHPPRRSAEAQAELDRRTRALAVYQYEACPFCVKTRRAITRLGLNIEYRDARKHPAYREELVKQGGKEQVPCLRIAHDAAPPTWLYESEDIIRYLRQRFGDSA
ncbi:MAG: glutathione S-transferase N-terminal domain-containing protein [Gammaproteobacteria bacterium]|jgi:glutaredoxin